MSDSEHAKVDPNEPGSTSKPKLSREPATAVLPDLTDLFDRRIDPQRRAGYDRRTFPHWAVPGAEPELGEGGQRPPMPDVVTPTFRFDRGRRGFAAVVARPIGHTLVMSSPLFLSGSILLLANVGVSRFTTDAIPIVILGVWGIQVLGLLIARGLAYPEWAAVWATLVVAIGVLVPLLALQSLLGGIPYVSFGKSSAGPFLAVSVAVLIAVTVSAAGVAMLSRQQPERASILLLPIALITPALLGMPTEVLARSIVGPLAAALLASGAWAALIWLAPRGVWLLATPIALVVQLAVLLVRGGGPTPGLEAGAVVAVGYGAVLATVVVIGVALPLVARWLGTISGGRSR